MRGASAADISFSKGNVLVLDKFETLIAVERELRVARHQGHAFSDGVRDDDMVARVAVVVGLIEAQTAVSVTHVSANGQELNVEFFFDGLQHFGRVLEIAVQQFLVVELHYQFAHALGTGEEHVLRVVDNVPCTFAAQSSILGAKINKKAESAKLSAENCDAFHHFYL